MNAPAIVFPSDDAAAPIPVGQSRQRPEPWLLLASKAQAGGFRLRCPAESPAGLIGPYWGEGDCLAPVFRDGSNLKWFDPSIPADDGDFVLVELSRRLIDELWDRNSHRPEFVAAYGAKKPPQLFATKWLRHFRGEHYICERDKGVPLWDNRILGVLTYVIQDGVPCYGSGPDHCGWADAAAVGKDSGIILNDASGEVTTVQIGEHAVTELVSATSASESFSLGLAGVQTVIDLTVPSISVAYTLRLSAHFEVWNGIGDDAQTVGITLQEDNASGTFVPVGSAVVRSLGGVNSSTNRARLAMVVDINADASQQYYVALIATNGANGSNNWNFEAITLTAQGVKR